MRANIAYKQSQSHDDAGHDGILQVGFEESERAHKGQKAKEDEESAGPKSSRISQTVQVDT